jgi:hypothetical protein
VARTAITPTLVVPGGTVAAPVAVDASASPNGMSYPAAPRRIVRVKTTGTPTTMTIQTNAAVAGLALAAATVTFGATVDEYAGPFGSHHTQADGNVYLNFSSATGATIEVIDPGS